MRTHLLVIGLSLCACIPDVIEAASVGPDDETDSAGTDEIGSDEASDANDTGDGDGDPAGFRVVVLADPHVVAPDYAGEDPNLAMTKQRLETTRQQIAAIDPPPAFAIVLGDLVHEAYASSDPTWYTANPNAFAEIDALLDGFPIPVHVVFGESDYAIPEQPKTLSHQLFAQFFAKQPYYSIEHEGWRFVFTNSQLGPSFEPANLEFNPALGSYGEAQLDWIAAELSHAQPTVLLTHFPLFQAQAFEAPDGTHRDIVELVNAFDNVALVLCGHLHQWNSLPQQYDAPLFVFGATRYDSDNFLLIEFHDDGSLQVLDASKPDWGTPNADTWTYQGTPAPAG